MKNRNRHALKYKSDVQSAAKVLHLLEDTDVIFWLEMVHFEAGCCLIKG